MTAYKTAAELKAAYADRLELDGMHRHCAELVANRDVVYVPHKYRGGFVVRGFGFSVERIGKYVLPGTCGTPETV